MRIVFHLLQPGSLALAGLLTVHAAAAQTDDRQFTLLAAPELVDSGLMNHILPRFALKTGRKAQLAAAPTDADLRADIAEGSPAFAREGVVYRLRVTGQSAPAVLFRDWLLSPAGQAAVTGFSPATGAAFSPAPAIDTTAPIEITGDAQRGEAVARQHCTRCHSIAPGDRSNIGSTPSFMALRALPDWDERFMSFYALNPHPSFLRIRDLSPPFDPARPPSLIPIELEQEDVEALLAYASSLTPADLGAEVQSR